MTFEQNEKRLEEIVNLLQGDVSLEEGTKLFEEGANLIKESLSLLTKTKGNIETINKDLDKFINDTEVNE